MSDTTTTPNGQTPTSVEPTGTTPQTPNGQTPNGTITQQTQKTEISSLPLDIQEYIKSLRTEAEQANRKAKTDAEKREKELAEAEAAKLREQGEYKTLLEKTDKRVQELEPIAERYSRLSELTKGQIQAQIKDWPEEIKGLLPQGDAVDAVDLLEAVDKFRPLVTKMTVSAKPGNAPNPIAATTQAGNLPKFDYSRRA